MYKKLTFGEFFSGPGGMSLGAIMANVGLGSDYSMTSMFAVDYDPDACMTYHANIHGEKGLLHRQSAEGNDIPGINLEQPEGVPLVLNADVRDVNPKNLHDVDAFLFGFPCNDFSNAGERKGLDGSFGQLYKEGMKLIEEKRPMFFVAENVSGLLHANNYGAFIEIMTELQFEKLREEGHNYIITPHLYKFEEYGVPQTRHRIIVVGIRADIAAEVGCKRFQPPAPTHLGKFVPVGEILDEVANPYPDGVWNNEDKKINAIVKERLEKTNPGENIWEAMKRSDFPEHLKIKATKTCISSIYKILDPTKPAYTVVGSGGGGTHMYHWEGRVTTDRERARIQTFPDGYNFHGGPTAVRRQIGMAVPPDGAKVIIQAVLKTLNGETYDSVPPNLDQEMDPEFVKQKQIKRQKQLEARERKRRREEEARRAALPQPELVGDFTELLRIRAEKEEIEKELHTEVVAEVGDFEISDDQPDLFFQEAAE